MLMSYSSVFPWVRSLRDRIVFEYRVILFMECRQFHRKSMCQVHNDDNNRPRFGSNTVHVRNSLRIGSQAREPVCHSHSQPVQYNHDPHRGAIDCSRSRSWSRSRSRRAFGTSYRVPITASREARDGRGGGRCQRGLWLHKYCRTTSSIATTR